MARIDFVMFSLTLILSVQFVVSEDSADVGPGSVSDANEKQDDKVTKEVQKDVSDGLRDATNKGIVKDTAEDLDQSASPQQDEKFLMKLFLQALMKITDEGKVDPKVLKEKLFPGGTETIDPKIEPEVIQALKDAMGETEIVEVGAVDSTKPPL